MALWQDTYPELFEEVLAAKEKAKADYLAGLFPPNPAVVPGNKLVGLIDVIEKAQFKAILNHLGPRSSDGSVVMDVVIDGITGVKRLDLRASASWERVTADPTAGAGLAKNPMTIVWQTDGGTPALPVAIWIKTGTPDTSWTRLWPAGTPGGEVAFIKAYALDFTAQPAQILYDGGADYTIDSRSWVVLNKQNLFGNHYPRITGTSAGLIWMDNTSAMPIVASKLSDLGVPSLKDLSELWVFGEFAIPSGDSSSYENLQLLVGTLLGAGYVQALYSDFGYAAEKLSNVSEVSSKTRGRTVVPSGQTSIACPSTLDAADTHTVMAIRMLPNCAEIYTGSPSDLCTRTFESLRDLLTLKAVLYPANSTRAYTVASAWAGATDVYLQLTSTANRYDFGNTGPQWKRLRLDYALAGTAGPQGDPGVDGSTWYTGAGAPSDSLGVNGDYYLREDSVVYHKVADTWGTGVMALHGSTWYAAAGAPSGTAYLTTDKYLNTTNGDVYHFSGGSWGSPVGNIKGVEGTPGTDGVDGTDGTDGAPGSVWHEGAGVPSDSLGIDGDYYVNRSTADLYHKASGSWGSSFMTISGGGGLVTAYEVDFSTLVDQNLMTGGDGAKTIDGKTWYLYRSADATAATVTNGTGILLDCNTNGGGNTGSNSQLGPRVQTPIANLLVSEPHMLAETWAWFMFSTPHIPNANYEGVAMGIAAGPETLTTASTFLHLHHGRVYSSALFTYSGYNTAGTETQRTFADAYDTWDVYAFRMVGPNLWQVYVGQSVAGAFPARADLVCVAAAIPLGANSLYAPLLRTTATQMWLYFNCFTGNSVGAMDAVLKKLKIEIRQ